MTNKNEAEFPVRELISFYVDNRIKKYSASSESCSSEQDSLEDKKISVAAKEGIYNSVKQEIISELTNEEYEKIKSNANDRFNTERTSNTLKHLTSMLVEGGLLAFVVGLLVNQITNWISIGIAGNHELYWTIGISLILFIIIVAIYLALFIRSVISFIENKDNHG